MFCMIQLLKTTMHKYQSIWDNPLADGDLPGEQETGNSHNAKAVAIKKYLASCWVTLQCSLV